MVSYHQHPALAARGLVKRFGTITAVDGLDLGLDPGEALGLLGPNGAGKSTTLSMMMGLVPPDAGQIAIFGHPAGSEAARRAIGATPQSAGFPVQLTPRELIAYTAARHADPAPVADLVEAFGLGRLIDRRMAGFSGGELRRVALALAFVGRPRLVFLDEPTTGLDTQGQEAFVATARAYVAQGGALVLTSHHWAEIEAICSRITLIDHGRCVLDGSLSEIRARTRRKRLHFLLDQPPPPWLSAEPEAGGWSRASDDSDALLRRMVAEGVGFFDLTVESLDLKAQIDALKERT